MSGGKVLRQVRAQTTTAGSGYDRLLAWMAGAGEATVRAAEKTNGQVSIRRVEVPRG